MHHPVSILLYSYSCRLFVLSIHFTNNLIINHYHQQESLGYTRLAGLFNDQHWLHLGSTTFSTVKSWSKEGWCKSMSCCGDRYFSDETGWERISKRKQLGIQIPNHRSQEKKKSNAQITRIVQSFTWHMGKHSETWGIRFDSSNFKTIAHAIGWNKYMILHYRRTKLKV